MLQHGDTADTTVSTLPTLYIYVLRVSTHSIISTLFTITILKTYTIAIVALIDLYFIHYLRHIHCLQYLHTTHYLLCARAREREIERVLDTGLSVAGWGAGAWLGNKQLRVVSKHHPAPTHHTPHQHSHCLRGMVL